MLLQGLWQRSTFSPEDVASDSVTSSKSSNLRSTLDHFEKWIGIVKLDVRFRSDKNCRLAGEELAENVRGKR